VRHGEADARLSAKKTTADAVGLYEALSGWSCFEGRREHQNSSSFMRWRDRFGYVMERSSAPTGSDTVRVKGKLNDGPPGRWRGCTSGRVAQEARSI